MADVIRLCIKGQRLWLLVTLFVLAKCLNGLQNPIGSGGQQEITRCTYEDFDDLMCDHGLYVQVTGAHYGAPSSSSSEVEFGCMPQLDDCVSDVQRENSRYFNEIYTKCNGKVSCDDLTAKGYTEIFCLDRLKPPTYVTIKYQCVEKKQLYPMSDAVQTFSIRCPGYNHVPNCPANNRIKIINGFYGSIPKDESCDWNHMPRWGCRTNMDYDMKGSMLMSTIRQQCDGRQECDVEVLPNQEPTSVICEDHPVMSEERYELLVYECVPDIKTSRKCSNDYVDDVYCEWGSTVQIKSASFGDSFGDNHNAREVDECEYAILPAAAGHCSVDVQFVDRMYYQRILHQCQCQRYCDDLTVMEAHVPWCRGGQSSTRSRTEYMTINYVCVINYESWYPWRGRLPIIPIAAGVAGLVLLIIIIVAIVMVCKYRKKRRERFEQERKQREQAAKKAKSRPPIAKPEAESYEMSKRNEPKKYKEMTPDDKITQLTPDTETSLSKHSPKVQTPPHAAPRNQPGNDYSPSGRNSSPAQQPKKSPGQNPKMFFDVPRQPYQDQLRANPYNSLMMKNNRSPAGSTGYQTPPQYDTNPRTRNRDYRDFNDPYPSRNTYSLPRNQQKPDEAAAQDMSENAMYQPAMFV